MARLTPRGAKQKGAGYERELAAYINERLPGLRTRRALLSGGGRNEGGADIDGTPRIHIEAKRTEAFRPYDAMAQAEEAVQRSGSGVVPVVVQRRSHMETGESLVVLRLAHFLDLYSAWLSLESGQRQDHLSTTISGGTPNDVRSSSL